MTEPEIPSEDDRQEITPTQVVTSGGTRNEYKYQFSHVDVDGIEGNTGMIFQAGKMSAGVKDGVLWYKYGENADPVFCDGTSVFCDDWLNRLPLAQDAYFMLSMCDEHGYVSRWRKR